MNSLNFLEKLTIAILFLSAFGVAMAQELPGAYVDYRGAKTLPNQFLVNRPGGAAAGNLVYVPSPSGCACTNLGGVSLICEDCDNEARVGYCPTHDRACRDAALKGGIREHDTFFCTTLSD